LTRRASRTRQRRRRPRHRHRRHHEGIHCRRTVVLLTFLLTRDSTSLTRPQRGYNGTNPILTLNPLLHGHPLQDTFDKNDDENYQPEKNCCTKRALRPYIFTRDFTDSPCRRRRRPILLLGFAAPLARPIDRPFLRRIWGDVGSKQPERQLANVQINYLCQAAGRNCKCSKS